jgi:hypothetical protein
LAERKIKSFKKFLKPQPSQDTAKNKTQPKVIGVEREGVQYRLAEDQKTLRAVPDLADLARRGGMSPSDGAAPRLGAIGDDLAIERFGHGTATVLVNVRKGLAKDIEAARGICIVYPEKRDPNYIWKLYNDSFSLVGPEWIQLNIIDRMEATDHEQMAREVEEKLDSNPTVGPALRPWRLPERQAELPAQDNKTESEVSLKPNKYRFVADQKMADPANNPTMTAHQISAVLGISLSAVYEHPGLTPFNTGIGKRLWTTLSVIAVRDSTAQ